eukprot:jgi/Chlat1/1029/Chrsp109S01460
MDGYVQPNLSTPLQPSSEYYNGFGRAIAKDFLIAKVLTTSSNFISNNQRNIINQVIAIAKALTTSNNQRNISNNMTLSSSHLVCKCLAHNQGWLHSSYHQLKFPYTCAPKKLFAGPQNSWQKIVSVMGVA